MKTTISNIGQMRAANKGKKTVYAPYGREVFHAEQLHRMISGECINSVDFCKDKYRAEYMAEHKNYIKTYLTGGR